MPDGSDGDRSTRPVINKEELLKSFDEFQDKVDELKGYIEQIEVIVERESRKSRLMQMAEHVLIGILVTLVIHLGGEKIVALALLWAAGTN